MENIRPTIIKLTVKASENILENKTLKDKLPFKLKSGSVLNTRLSIIATIENQVQFNKDGIWQDMVKGTVWDSFGQTIKTSDIRMKNADTITVCIY